MSLSHLPISAFLFLTLMLTFYLDYSITIIHLLQNINCCCCCDSVVCRDKPDLLQTQHFLQLRHSKVLAAVWCTSVPSVVRQNLQS